MNKTAILLENYIVYDNGKKIPWSIVWEVVRQLDRSEVIERMRINKRKIIRYENSKRDSDTHLNEERILLGLKEIKDETQDAMRKRILKKIKMIESPKTEAEPQ